MKLTNKFRENLVSALVENIKLLNYNEDRLNEIENRRIKCAEKTNDDQMEAFYDIKAFLLKKQIQNVPNKNFVYRLNYF